MPRTTYHYRLKKFRKQGLLRQNKKGLYRLTTKAISKIKDFKNKKSPLKKPGDLWTVIIFDIPENYHDKRNTLRRYLIRNNYTQVQKSVLISKFEISKEIITLTKNLKISQYVTFFEGKPIYP